MAEIVIVRTCRGEDAAVLPAMSRRLRVGALPWRDEEKVVAAIEASLSDAVRHSADPGSAVFVAEIARDVVGAVTVAERRRFTGTPEAVVEDLFVAETVEGAGAGQAFARAC